MKNKLLPQKMHATLAALLCMMALMPLTAWAANSVSTITFTENVTSNSTVYVGEVVVDGTSVIKYLYSGDVAIKSSVIQNLLDGLNGMTDKDYHTLLSGQDFDYEAGAKGLALCADPEKAAAMNANWSSARYVGNLFFPSKTLTSEINSNLYDLDDGFKATLDAQAVARAAEIETLADVEKCIVTHLDSRTVTDVYYTIEGGQVVRHFDTNVIYDSEATTVIYTKVELETLMTETPLTFEAVEAGTITVNLDEGATLEAIQYKLNDAEWTAVTWGEAIDLDAHDVISFRGDNGTCYINDDDLEIWAGFHFECSNPCYVYGNMMSLIDEDGFATNTTLTEPFTFFHLFQTSDYEPNNTILNHPTKDIVLPATTLTANCYDGLFADCQGITRATELPATTLADWCYCMMFSGTGITTAPALPASTLADACYSDMFMNCTNLTTAPELPATVLAEGCYSSMFAGCTSLNYVKCLATDISADFCTTSWMWNVAPTGTFVKAAGIEDWTTGEDGIPEGWTVKAEYTVPSSGIGTFSSPTNMLLPDGLTAHYCTTYNNSSSTIAVSDIDGGIVPANTGVLMRGTGGETYLLTVTTDAAADITDNALVAVVEATHIEPTSGDYTNFMLKSGKFVKIAADNGDVKMPANRAYLQVLTSEIPTGGDAKSISLLWGGDVTVIGDPSVGDAVPAQWYTIDGRKLNAKPTAKGLYIVNGKKVIIR